MLARSRNTDSYRSGYLGGVLWWHKPLHAIPVILVLAIIYIVTSSFKTIVADPILFDHMYDISSTAQSRTRSTLNFSFLWYVNIFVYYMMMFLGIIAYVRCVLTDPGVSVPLSDEEEYKVSLRLHHRDHSEHHRDWNQEQPNSPTYCTKCAHSRPPRAHHCQVCRRCVYKMDHHCLLVANCIGASNCKYFYLFIAYSFFGCVNTFVSIIIKVGNPLVEWEDQKLVTLGILLSVASSWALFLFDVMHAVLLVRGQTTIEMGSLDNFPYNVGWKKNLKSVFGSSLFWCWIPSSGPCDGTWYELNSELYDVRARSEGDVEAAVVDRSKISKRKVCIRET